MGYVGAASGSNMDAGDLPAVNSAGTSSAWSGVRLRLRRLDLPLPMHNLRFKGVRRLVEGEVGRVEGLLGESG